MVNKTSREIGSATFVIKVIKLCIGMENLTNHYIRNFERVLKYPFLGSAFEELFHLNKIGSLQQEFISLIFRIFYSVGNIRKIESDFLLRFSSNRKSFVTLKWIKLMH